MPLLPFATQDRFLDFAGISDSPPQTSAVTKCAKLKLPLGGKTGHHGATSATAAAIEVDEDQPAPGSLEAKLNELGKKLLQVCE